MKWLSEPTHTAYWATHTGYLPVTEAALPLMKSYYTSHPYQKIAANSLMSAREMPPVPNFDEAVGALANAISEATIGHQSVGTALTNAQTTAVKDLAH